MNLTFSISAPRNHRIAVSAFFFIAGLTFATWASRIPDIKTQLQLSEAGLGAILLALPVGLMASLPISGWLVSKYGSRRIVITAALLYPLVLLLLAISANTWQLSIALFVFGLFGNLINISMNTQAVSVETQYGRSIMASFHGLWSLAGFSGAAIGTLLVSIGTPLFAHFSIIFVLSALIVLIFYKDTYPADTVNSESQPFFVKPDRSILNLGLIAFCSMICEGAMADWSGVYFQEVVESPKALTTLGYVAFAGSMATGRFIADWLVTKVGVRKMLQFSGLLITAGLLVAVLFPNLLTALLGFLMVGLGVSSVVPIVYGLAGKSNTLSPGFALAAVSSISFLGFLLGPPLIGFIAQAGSLRWSFAIISLLGITAVFLAKKLKDQ